jgi:hypothetical protein
MLENMVDALIKRIKDEVIKDPNMQDIPLAYLMKCNVPDSVKHFFNQEVELWIREEEEKFSSNERFNYDMPEVRMLIDKIFDFLKQNAHFHITKFNQLLERAVKLETNYTVEPQRTLTQFIFKDSPIVSTIEVYDTLKYFFKYEYYIKAISDYFNTKYLREISQDQFRDLIAQIDDNVFKENLFETTLKVVKSIAGFISEAMGEEVTYLNCDILLHAFKDRNLEVYVKLIKKLDSDDKKEITLIDLENILRDESLDSLKAAAVVEPEEEEAKSIMKEIKDIEESKPEVKVEGIKLGEMKVEEVEEEVEEEEEEEEEEEVELAEKAAPPKARGEKKVANDLADFVATQIKSDQPLQSIDDMIKGRTRKKIIKRLFKKKEKDYVSFINSLNDQPSWKEASIIIDEEFYQRGINPYSKEAITFSDIVYNRFFPKDKYVGEKDASVKWD